MTQTASAASLNIVDSYYIAILRMPPSDSVAQTDAMALDDGSLTAAQLKSQLLVAAQGSSLPALLTYDLFYSKTPASSGLTYLATYADALGSGNYTVNAAGQFQIGTTPGEFSSTPYSVQNIYVNLGASFATDPNATFAATYGLLDRSDFIDQVYTRIFGAAPAASTQQYLLDNFQYYVDAAGSELGGYGAVAGLLMSQAEASGAGFYPTSATSFLAFAAVSTAAGADAALYNSNVLAHYPPPASKPAPASVLNAADPAPGAIITITGSNQVITPGAGNHTIQFLTGASNDTIVLSASGDDQISGFDPMTDVLDLRGLLAGASIDLNGDMTALGRYISITDQGSDALVNFDPTGQGGGSTIAVLHGLGDTVTGLNALLARQAVRIS